MRRSSKTVWLAGVDGCKGGWIAARVRPRGGDVHVAVFENFADLLEEPNAPAIIAVDIPIGFPAHSFGGREGDNAVRSLLGNRASSVFPMPSRKAIFAEPGPFADRVARYKAHQRACAVAEATSTPPKRITIFAFAIFAKIRQVDTALQRNPAHKSRVFETHPEFAFWQLNERNHLTAPKTSEAGRDLRRRLLMKAGLPSRVVKGNAPKGAKSDDLLDALVCAVVARRIYDKTAACLPQQPVIDETGLRMAIWA